MPVKDRLTQDRFEALDLKTCRRLRPVDAGSTVRDASGISHGDEGSQKIAIQIFHQFFQYRKLKLCVSQMPCAALFFKVRGVSHV